jgi:ribosomal protein S12 methylthiotransferase accessory factor
MKNFDGLSVLFSGPLSLIGQVQRMPNYLKPLDFYVYSIAYRLEPEWSLPIANPLSISGADFTEKGAKVRCIGEAIERFCWYYASNWKKLEYRSYREFKKWSINPYEFASFSCTQYKKRGFPFQPFRDDLRIYWIEGEDITTGEKIFVPAQLCLGKTKDHFRIWFSTTTGVSAERDYYKCLYKSLCEVIERDAFMITWLNKISPPDIKVNWDLVVSGLSEKLKVSNYRLKVFLLPTDINLKVVLAINVNREYQPPFLSVGASCSVCLLEAVKKAILESFHCLNFLFDAKINGIEIKDLEKIRGFDEHALLYSSPEVGKRASFLYRSNYKARIEVNRTFRKELDHKKECQEIVANLKKLGYRVIVLDLTPVEIRETGFYVLKVLIPGFIDLGLRNFYYLEGKRIYTLPQKLGLESKKEDNLNTLPHPFP